MPGVQAMHSKCCVVAMSVAMLAILGTSAPRADSVEDVFERHKLLGTFAWDCNRPPTKDNLYYLIRLIDSTHAQRDQMSGPTNRDNVAVIDKAAMTDQNVITVGGTVDGQPFTGQWRVQHLEAPLPGGGTKSLYVDEPNHTRIYKCENDGRTLNVTYDENVNREGETIREFDLPEATARVCQVRCIGDPQCTAWVYRKPQGRTDRQPHCWLRRNITTVERGAKDNLTISGSIRPEASR